MLAPGYKGEVTTGLSPALWGDLPVEQWRCGLNGFFFHDDFTNGPSIAATGATATGGYGGYTTSSSATIAPSAVANTGDLFGVELFSPNNTANVETYMGTGNGAGGLFLSPTSSDVGKTFAFECRLCKSGIGANTGFFIGLGDTALSITTGSLAATTGAPISTGNFLGFLCRMDGGVNVDCMYQAASQTLQTNITTAKVLVAATYTKLGFKYVQQNPTTAKLKWYIDGVEQGTYVTDAQVIAATFPSSIIMAMLCLVKQKTTTANTVSLDWWGLGVSRSISN